MSENLAQETRHVLDRIPRGCGDTTWVDRGNRSAEGCVRDDYRRRFRRARQKGFEGVADTRVDGQGAESEEPRNPQEIPHYVHHRSAL